MSEYPELHLRHHSLSEKDFSIFSNDALVSTKNLSALDKKLHRKTDEKEKKALVEYREQLHALLEVQV